MRFGRYIVGLPSKDTETLAVIIQHPSVLPSDAVRTPEENENENVSGAESSDAEVI